MCAGSATIHLARNTYRHTKPTFFIYIKILILTYAALFPIGKAFIDVQQKPPYSGAF